MQQSNRLSSRFGTLQHLLHRRYYLLPLIFYLLLRPRQADRSTEFGTYRLKFFFSESLSTESGEEVSTREVKKILSDLIEGESKKKPLSDEKLTELLQEKGYNIARRTVAKYREQLNIPVARLRKEL